MTQRLWKLLRDLDRPNDRIYPHDEIMMVNPWPRGSLELLTSLGIVELMDEPGEVFLDDCIDPDWSDPDRKAKIDGCFALCARQTYLESHAN